GLAFLYHVPAVWPYWLAIFGLALIQPSRDHVRGLMLMGAAVALLLVLSQLQAGESEHQEFFARLDPSQEALMRTRASYIFVSMWDWRVFAQYALLWTASLGALWRLRDRVPADFRFLALAMPAIGIASIPACWLLLERVHWSLIPQIQPARALLYVTAFAIVLSAAAGVAAAQSSRWIECAAWFAAVYSLPAQTRTVFTLFESRAALVVLAL